MNSSRRLTRQKQRLLTVLSVLIIASLACNLPFAPKPTSTPTSGADAPGQKAIAKQPLPPVIVETSPLPASTLPLSGEVVLTFDQPMDRSSVEAAVRVDPVLPGRFVWQDDTTVKFVPDQPLAPETRLTLTVGENARSAEGQSLLRESSFTFRTATLLQAVEKFPKPDTDNANPSSTVAVTFNQPVVALGADDGSPAFTLEPSVEGKGTWLNTSTYTFQPDPAMGGGLQYTVHLNPDLTSLAGVPFAGDTEMAWQFTTALPALIEVLPAASAEIGLDEEFRLTFNQPMDTASVEQDFSLQDAAGNVVGGEFTWSERGSILSFKPSRLLARGNDYVLQLTEASRSRGGTGLPIKTLVEYHTVGEFGVSSTVPLIGRPLKVQSGMGSIEVKFNAPLAEGQDLSRLVQVSPRPGNFSITPSADRRAVYLYGSYLEGTTYRLELAEDLQDRWGGKLGMPFTTSFLVADSTPALQIPILYFGGRAVFAEPGDSLLPAFATNLDSLTIAKAELSRTDFLRAFYSFSPQTIYQFNQPERWQQALTLPLNRSEGIEISLTPDGSPLQAGFYVLQIDSPDLRSYTPGYDFALVVAPSQVTIKENEDEIFLWVTNLQTGRPVANVEVQVYTGPGEPQAAGNTQEDGTARIPLPRDPETYRQVLVIAGEPGSDDFGVGMTSWSDGISPWEFGLPTRYERSERMGYLYTDRPIYRPGQTVYFRAVLRDRGDARYSPVSIDRAIFQLFGGEPDPAVGQVPLLDTVELELSPYGTASGQFNLPEDASPGNYFIQMQDQDSRIDFQVAEYRKPEIDLRVDFARPEYRMGEDIQALIQADYYFGGAASNTKVRWTLYSRDDYFFIPGGYTTGPVDTGWLNPSGYSLLGFSDGRYVTSGEGMTGADGALALSFSAADLAVWLDQTATQNLVLQVELVDESGQTVSRRALARLHPEDFYIGIKPDRWIAAAGDAVGFAIQTSDWAGQPSGNRQLSAVFQRVEWAQDWANVQTGQVNYTEQLTEIGSVDFSTDAGGQARLEFTVAEPGAYRLDVTGGQAVSQVLLWAGGAGSVPGPELPDQHIHLQSDRESYQPGETAEIFIPNPLPQGATALITVERRGVLRSQVVDLSGSSQMIRLDILPEDAPNVYISALLVGRSGSGQPDFRLGYLELSVDASALLLDVKLTPEESRLAPGQNARIAVEVKDAAGKPVQGEFSIAVVDKAIFALAEPNEADIMTAFYGQQPLEVFTSTSLTAYTRRIVTVEPGFGQGGGGTAPAPLVELREDFRDTAYWSGTFETGADGKAVIDFPVPDNLTTWVATVRGLTRDTRVGEATVELLVTKDLIVRPVTPRFMVAGDRVQLGAVVNNNTGQSLVVTVELQASGVSFGPDSSVQTVRVAAGGRQRVDWWVEVRDAGAAELIFSARSGALQDAATPPFGQIPILHYTAPMTFATSGLMTTGGENLEVVSLPRSYEPTGGELRVEMGASLAGTVLSSLEVMESYPFDLTEPVLSHLLANLAAYDLLGEANGNQAGLTSRLQKAIRQDLDRLPNLQNPDGGFGWARGTKSDLYLTSYAVLALTRAKQAGFLVRSKLISDGRLYLVNNQGAPDSAMESWQLDRLAMLYYALDQSGTSSNHSSDLFPLRERLSPWAKALLASVLIDEDEAAARTLLSDLQGLAIRSATGVNWQDEAPAWQNFTTPNFTTAIVVYVLAGQDPASPQLADAVRYLVAHRNATGGWYSSYDTAWILTALSRYVQVSGELQGEFEYSAVLNGAPMAQGSAGSVEPWTLVRAEVPLSELSRETGNSLRFIRGEGAGRLYYRAFLEVGQPVESAAPVDRGLTVSREYVLAEAECGPHGCPAVNSVSIQASNPVVDGRVTVTVPQDMYYVVVEDRIPAGMEIINLRLKTAPVIVENQVTTKVDAFNPFARGWGWWWFDEPVIYDDHIRWVADYLPAGTYTLVYRLQPLVAGEFRVIPARAYTYYFPEVEGRSAGAIFTIEE